MYDVFFFHLAARECRFFLYVFFVPPCGFFPGLWEPGRPLPILRGRPSGEAGACRPRFFLCVFPENLLFFAIKRR